MATEMAVQMATESIAGGCVAFVVPPSAADTMPHSRWQGKICDTVLLARIGKHGQHAPSTAVSRISQVLSYGSQHTAGRGWSCTQRLLAIR